jgi:diketogulonate reductase-like aldo/keto reductase
MINKIFATTTLANGIQMPWFGLGLYKVQEEKVEQLVHTAVEYGYRSFDTAALYKNEHSLGEAIRSLDTPREQLFITSKVWNTDQGYEETLAAFDASMERLGLDYLDLYLIHWPVPGKYIDTWKALEKIYEEKRVRAIGVSNFHIHHLQDILHIATVKPMVNQVELHPKLSQRELHVFCKEQGIQLEAWSPLMRGRLQEDKTLKAIADKYGKTIAQVILRWDLQREIVTIPKTENVARLKENANIFDFVLSEEDMAIIDGLNENIRTGKDPDNFSFS